MTTRMEDSASILNLHLRPLALTLTPHFSITYRAKNSAIDSPNESVSF